MRKNLFSHSKHLLRIVVVCLSLTVTGFYAGAQCPLSPFSHGSAITPDACGWQTLNNVGSGTYVPVNVHNGGIYDFSMCNNVGWADDQLTAYSASSLLFYRDNFGPICPGSLHASETWASNYTGSLNLQINQSNCVQWTGISGVLDYRCTGPGNPSVYGNGQWLLYGWNAGDANGGAGAWSQCYSGFMPVNQMSFNTTTLWAAAGSPSDNSTFLGCEIAPNNHSWSAKRTGFTCGVYQIVVDYHDDLAQVIINGNTTTLPGVGGPTTVYTGILSNSSTVEFRVSEGTGSSQAQITITPVSTGAIDAGSIAADQQICPGGDPAPFTSVADASGGVGPAYTGGSYTYEWFYRDSCQTAPVSTGASTTTYDPPSGLLNDRCYYRVVTDACGNTSTSNTVSVALGYPPTVTNVTVNNTSCFGGSNGSLVISAIGDNPPFFYSIDNGTTFQSSPTFTGLSAGSYNVAIHDVINCSTTYYSGNPVILGEPTDITQTVSKTDASCASVYDGTISVSASGGTPPFQYSLNGGPLQPGSNFSGLSENTYTVYVYDANNCVDTSSVTINSTYVVSVNVVSQSDITCYGGGDGSLTVQLVGGVPPFQYSLNGIAYQSSGTFSGLSAGTYIVIGRDSKGCLETVNVTIAQPGQLSVVIDSITNVLCNGTGSGGIYITPSGGTPGYSYAWSNGPTTEDNIGVGAGTYVVTISDANNCTAVESATVNAPVALFLSVAIHNDLFCYNDSSGAIDVTANGGVPQYSFVWSNGETTEDLVNLKAGCYSVTVTDANACTQTLTQCLTEPSEILSSVIGTNVSCAGASDGTADLTVSGGTPPYFYQWSTGQASQDLTGKPGGVYYVVITDNNGCDKRDSVVITEPAPLVLSTVVTNITCHNADNGAIDLIVSGGTPGYTYAWGHGATTEDLDSLSGALYCVTVTDAGGCTASICVQLVNPPAINTNFIITDARCYGDTTGAINLIPSGGTPPFTFSWSNGATTEDISNVVAGVYSVTLTDSRNCVWVDSAEITQPAPLVTSGFIKNVTCFGYNDGAIDITAYGGTLPYGFQWSTGQTTEDVVSLPGGNYFVSVTDGENCLVVSLYVVNEPSLLTTSINSTNPLCFGVATGSVAVVPSGGSTPYEYLWNNFVTDSMQSGITAGRYVVLVTDSNGCHTYDSVTITEPSEIMITGVVTDATCSGFFNGAIDITVTGGTGSYTYLWSTGATTEDLSGLEAGTYRVTVTDANNCIKTAQFTVKESISLFTNVSINNPLCFGSTDGFVAVSVAGGSIPYSYSWSTTPPQSGAIATNLGEGSYTLTVSDANNCSATITATLFDPVAINITATPTPAHCFNTATGLVTATVTGGTPPYLYQLNGVIQPSNVFTNLLPGNYIIAVRDANGCEAVQSFTINEPTPVTVDLVATQDVILQGMSTQLIATANSSLPIVNYSWSPLTDTAGNSIFDFSNCPDPDNCNNPYVAPLFTTIFTVAVMNSDSCLGYDTAMVIVEARPSAFIPNAFTPNSDNLNDYFEFDILGAKEIEISIFSRWGERVYYNPAQHNGIFNNGDAWNGTKDDKTLPYDTYVYQMKVTYQDGIRDFPGLMKEKAGTVTIIE